MPQGLFRAFSGASYRDISGVGLKEVGGWSQNIIGAPGWGVSGTFLGGLGVSGVFQCCPGSQGGLAHGNNPKGVSILSLGSLDFLGISGWYWGVSNLWGFLGTWEDRFWKQHNAILEDPRNGVRGGIRGIARMAQGRIRGHFQDDKTNSCIENVQR